MASIVGNPDPEVTDQPPGTVRVPGKGYVRIAMARAYQAAGLHVDWGTALPDPDQTRALQYKEPPTKGEES